MVSEGDQARSETGEPELYHGTNPRSKGSARRVSGALAGPALTRASYIAGVIS
jgi:hypothetical protein